MSHSWEWHLQSLFFQPKTCLSRSKTTWRPVRKFSAAKCIRMCQELTKGVCFACRCYSNMFRCRNLTSKDIDLIDIHNSQAVGDPCLCKTARIILSTARLSEININNILIYKPLIEAQRLDSIQERCFPHLLWNLCEVAWPKLVSGCRMKHMLDDRPLDQTQIDVLPQLVTIFESKIWTDVYSSFLHLSIKLSK